MIHTTETERVLCNAIDELNKADFNRQKLPVGLLHSRYGEIVKDPRLTYRGVINFSSVANFNMVVHLVFSSPLNLKAVKAIKKDWGSYDELMTVIASREDISPDILLYLSDEYPEGQTAEVLLKNPNLPGKAWFRLVNDAHIQKIYNSSWEDTLNVRNISPEDCHEYLMSLIHDNPLSDCLDEDDYFYDEYEGDIPYPGRNPLEILSYFIRDSNVRSETLNFLLKYSVFEAQDISRITKRLNCEGPYFFDEVLLIEAFVKSLSGREYKDIRPYIEKFFENPSLTVEGLLKFMNSGHRFALEVSKIITTGGLDRFVEDLFLITAEQELGVPLEWKRKLVAVAVNEFREVKNEEL